MKRMLVTAIAMCLCVSAWAQQNRAAGSQPNTLTSQEKQEGWILLFDGKTLDQWNVTPALAKLVAAVSIVSWMTVAAGGRLIMYL